MVACAFMREKTAGAYVKVFRALKRELPELVMPAHMGDYVGALRAAVRAEFPGARIYGCLFHYAQRRVKRVESPTARLASERRHPGPALKKCPSFVALYLLSQEHIYPTYVLCAEEALAVTADFQPFLGYVRRQWLDNIGPERLPLFRAPCRTNNSVESSNAALKRQVGARAATWNLIATSVNIAQDFAIDIRSHAAGERNIRSRPSRATKTNEQTIGQLWDMLDANEITPKTFVDRAKYRVGGSLMKRGLFADHEEQTPVAQALHVLIG